MPSIADFFTVRTTVQTGATATGTFGLGLLLTSAADLPAGGPRKAQLANSSAAARELTDDDDAREAIDVWFGQPQTPEGLYLGRWASADVSTTLRGGTAPTVAAGAGALNASNASFHYDGNDYALDLSGSATYAAIATVIQTAIAANLTGATFTYDTASGRFLLTRADAAPGDAFFAPHSAGTGTDATVELGMALASDPLHLQGHDAEDPDEAWNEINGSVAGREPVLCMRDDGTPDTYGTAAADTDDALKAFAQTLKALYLTRANTTAPIQDAFDNQQHHVGSFLTDAGELPDVGAAARLSAVDYSNAATQISLHGKALSNVAPTAIDDTAFAALQLIRGNIYTTVDGNPSIIDGYSAHSDYYLDESYGLIWLENELAQAQWSALRNSRRLTRAGLLRALNASFTQAVFNGILQAGLAVRAETAADIRRTTGNIAFGAGGDATRVLIHGFLVWVGPVAGRRAPWKAWAAGSEAIHRTNGDLIFLNDLQEAAEAA